MCTPLFRPLIDARSSLIEDARRQGPERNALGGVVSRQEGRTRGLVAADPWHRSTTGWRVGYIDASHRVGIA